MRLHTYTCFAPALMRRSCLINLMIILRSLPVHLQGSKVNSKGMV